MSFKEKKIAPRSMGGISQVYQRSIATCGSEPSGQAAHPAFEHLSLAICHELQRRPDAGSGSTLHVRQQRQLRNVLAASASSGPSIQL